MKKFSKITSMIVAAMLVASSLSGCASGGGSSSTDSGSSSDTGSKDTSSSSETPKEAVTIKWYQLGDKEQDHDVVIEELNKTIAEKINATLDLQMIPTGEFNDKLKLISTSGEDYDITFTSNWVNSFIDNLSRSAFLALDDLYAEHGKGIATQVPEWLLDAAKVDGKLYAIPNQQMVAHQIAFCYQKELGEKYGFDKDYVEDISEIEPFLEEIVKNEPTLFPVDRIQPVTLFSEYEDFANGQIMIKKGDTSLTAHKVTDVILDQEKASNDWYKRGFIRKDVATVTDNTPDEKANKYATAIMTYKPGSSAEMTTRQGREWVVIPVGKAYVKAVAGSETMSAINVNSKNPAEAMKMIDLVYSDKEVFNTILFGFEGTHHSKLADNKVEPFADTKYSYESAGWEFGNQFNAWYLPGQEEGIWEETDKLNKESEISLLRGFSFDPTPVQAELAQLAAVEAEYKNRDFVAKDIDALHKEITQKKEQAGLDKLLEEFQKQVDAWATANGKK